jgi:diguanylate cyclase (GGDEF)-like protein
MQQFKWMSLVDAMFLESKQRRDVVEILINSLGLDSERQFPNQLSELGQASFESFPEDELLIKIHLSSSRIIRIRAHDESRFLELQSFAHLAQLALTNASQRESLVLASMTDQLTSLLNRRGWEHYLSSVMPTCGTLVFLDVDGLKQVNQMSGYQSADDKLRMIGSVLSIAFRSTDCACRWGGDEFLVFLKDSNRVTTEKRILDVTGEITKLSQLNLTYGMAEVTTSSHDQNTFLSVIAIAQRAMEQRKLATG